MEKIKQGQVDQIKETVIFFENDIEYKEEHYKKLNALFSRFGKCEELSAFETMIKDDVPQLTEKRKFGIRVLDNNGVLAFVFEEKRIAFSFRSLKNDYLGFDKIVENVVEKMDIYIKNFPFYTEKMAVKQMNSFVFSIEEMKKDPNYFLNKNLLIRDAFLDNIIKREEKINFWSEKYPEFNSVVEIQNVLRGSKFTVNLNVDVNNFQINENKDTNIKTDAKIDLIKHKLFLYREFKNEVYNKLVFNEI